MPDGSHRGGATGWALAVFAAACWAASGVTARWVFSSGVDPAALAGVRSLIAFAVLLVYLATARRDLLRVSARDLLPLAAYGVLGLAAVHYAYYRTISLAGVATAILLEYLSPVLVLAYSVVVLRQRPTWALPAGVAASVAGCALVVGATGGPRLSGEALAWGLASAVLFAAYAVVGGHAGARWHPLTALLYGFAAAAVFWLVAIGPRRVLAPLVEPRTAAAAVFVAVFGAVLAFGAFLGALRRLDATRVMVASTIEPVLAAGAAWALLGEALTMRQVLGGALVLAAVVVVARAGGPAPPPGA
ncbi:MAG: hypothetical protein FDZ70_01060 [Actinobacteria bacterium]|nr:MAG: hypothetical protein FDZ70_01060 [Actinomycetota bacterium]